MTEVDLGKYIHDWYRCPLCNEIHKGLMDWASHTAQYHGLSCLEFEKVYGYYLSFFGTNWKFQDPLNENKLKWNPSRRYSSL